MAIFIPPFLILLTSNVTATVQPKTPLLHDGDSTGNTTICPLRETIDAPRNACQCVDISGDPLICRNSVSLILDCYCATVAGNITEVGQCAIGCVHRKNEKRDHIYQPLPSNRSSWNGVW